jgi:hypothetical protein
MMAMQKTSVALAIALAALASTPAFAQWLNQKTAGLPRNADGTPNLTAPAPRTPDGKADLSGIWQANGVKYLRDIAADLKPGDVPFQPWAEALFIERKSGIHAWTESDANCLPQGVPKINATPVPYRIVQTPGYVVILYEAFNLWRQVFTDGRSLPNNPNPSWLGYSVGKWEGDTLVVDSIGFNDKTWLDQVGHPLSDALHVTERFRRKDFGHMELEITIDDPKAYTKPWTVKQDPVLVPDTELLEFICNENEKDLVHMRPK